MKIKTSDLKGAALDWAVAKCENFYTDGFSIIRVWNNRVTKIIPGDYEISEVYTSYSPSSDWSQGGPIIEREKIGVDFFDVGNGRPAWIASKAPNQESGPTPLISAMRCFVASKLGDEVDVPKELLKEKS